MTPSVPGPWPAGQPAPTWHARPNFTLTDPPPVGNGDFGFGFAYFGGGDLLLSATIHITAAQLLNIRTAPITLVPLVTGKTLTPIAYYARRNYGGTPYHGSAVVGIGIVLAGLQMTPIDMTDNVDGILVNVGFPDPGGGSMLNPTWFVDQPIQLYSSNGQSLTDGNSTMDITTWYVVSP